MDRIIRIAACAFLFMVCGLTAIKAQNDMDVLNKKQQSLVAIAAFEAKGDIEGLKTALTDALNDGLTVNELKEVLSHLYAYTGFPRSLNGLGALQSVLEERKAKGIEDGQGNDASPLAPDYDALAQGTAVQTKLRGGKPFDYAFAPATDYYLKAHLFGDIFARDILTHAEREIVTVSALASMQGVESQLKSHIGGAKNMGVGDAEIHAIPRVLAAKVGDTEAYRAAKAIAEVYGEPFDDGKPVENMIFPKGEPNTAYARYFIGNSYLAPLLAEGLPMSNVTFEPRCRNNWHIHHKGGQILICVGGDGWYQEWGKTARKLRPGDVVNIPAEVKHWHGAAADSWFQHIAISIPAEGAASEWLEAVTDEEYDKLNEQNVVQNKNQMKTLTVYFSLTAGNTKGIAEKVHEAVGGDIVRLEPIKAYPEDYETVVSQGQREVDNDYKPQLKPLGVNLANYDRIIVGTPTWWYKMAPCVLSFLSSADLKGKTVVPFQTSAGWPGNTLDDMAAIVRKKGAVAENARHFRFSSDKRHYDQMETPEKELEEWIDKLTN